MPSSSTPSRSSSHFYLLPSQVHLPFLFFFLFLHHIFTRHRCEVLTFFTDILMLMPLGLEVEQSNVSTQENDTLTPSNKSQTDSLSGSTSGMEKSESGLSVSSKLEKSSSSGHFPARSPVCSSQGHWMPADPLVLDQDSLNIIVSEIGTGTSDSG